MSLRSVLLLLLVVSCAFAQVTVSVVPAPNPGSDPNIIIYNSFFDRPNNKSGWIYDTASTLSPPYRDLGQTFTPATSFYLDKVVVAISDYSDQTHLNACAGAPFHIDILQFASINEMEAPTATLTSQTGHLPAVLTLGVSQFLSFDLQNVALQSGKIYGFLLKFDSLKASRYLELVKSEDSDYYTGGKLLYTEFNGDDGRTNITIYKYKHAGGNVNRDLHFWLVKGDASGVMTRNPAPVSLQLFSNYPNPFNAATTLMFALTHRSRVRLELYDITGQKVADLAEGEYEAGSHQITVDGASLSSGLYYCRLMSDGQNVVHKMALIK
jgi:hypothetical protein